MLTLLVAAAVPAYTLEVERIWLFLTPLLVLPVAARLAAQERPTGRADRTTSAVLLLALQTLGVEVLVTTYW